MEFGAGKFNLRAGSGLFPSCAPSGALVVVNRTPPQLPRRMEGAPPRHSLPLGSAHRGVGRTLRDLAAGTRPCAWSACVAGCSGWQAPRPPRGKCGAGLARRLGKENWGPTVMGKGARELGGRLSHCLQFLKDGVFKGRRNSGCSPGSVWQRVAGLFSLGVLEGRSSEAGVSHSSKTV